MAVMSCNMCNVLILFVFHVIAVMTCNTCNVLYLFKYMQHAVTYQLQGLPACWHWHVVHTLWNRVMSLPDWAAPHRLVDIWLSYVHKNSIDEHNNIVEWTANKEKLAFIMKSFSNPIDQHIRFICMIAKSRWKGKVAKQDRECCIQYLNQIFPFTTD